MEPSLPADSDDSIADGTSSKKICRGIKDKSSSDPSLTMIVGEGAENQDASSLPMIVSSGDVSTKEDPERLICLSHGSLSIIGRGRAMEDAVTVAANQFAAYDFFAVYDGQGGCRVSQTCRDRMHHLLAVEMEGRESGGSGEEGVDWEKVMVACFSKMNDEVNRGEAEELAAPVQSVGSTAAVVLVAKEEVVVANCGNSRTVLCRDGVAVPLSRDQHHDRPDEKEKIEAAGGEIANWNMLGTSRGDPHPKPYVICKPEVTVINRTESDDFIVIASKGLWDVVPNEIVCEVISQCLIGKTKKWSSEQGLTGACAGCAAAMLTLLAVAQGSKDNISIIIVEL